MKECNICGAEETYPHGHEYLCLECIGYIEETLGELNLQEDEVDLDEEFWSEVLLDEIGDLEL